MVKQRNKFNPPRWSIKQMVANLGGDFCSVREDDDDACSSVYSPKCDYLEVTQSNVAAAFWVAGIRVHTKYKTIQELSASPREAIMRYINWLASEGAFETKITKYDKHFLDNEQWCQRSINNIIETMHD